MGLSGEARARYLGRGTPPGVHGRPVGALCPESGWPSLTYHRYDCRVIFVNMTAMSYLEGMTPVEIRLKEVRKDRGLTQVQLAEKAAIDQATISRIEAGTSSINLHVLDRLCGP